MTFSQLAARRRDRWREQQEAPQPPPARRKLPITVCESVSRVGRRNLNAYDHDLGGFNEGRRGLAFFQAHFACRIRRNDRRNALSANRKFYLGQQTAVAHFEEPADQLISTADKPEPATRGPSVFFIGARQKSLDFRRGNAMVPSGRLDAAQLLFVNPLLERGIADSQRACGVARVKQFLRAHGHLQKIHLYIDLFDMSIRINTSWPYNLQQGTIHLRFKTAIEECHAPSRILAKDVQRVRLQRADPLRPQR